jgi:S1-C subfamily serine protease
MDSQWFEIQRRLKNSVVQILATQGDFNIAQPYVPPAIKNARGSGFLISSEGHILTNAHVVANLLSVTFRSEQSGGLDLRATLVAICPAKDVALLKCHEDDLTQLGDFEALSFADDQNLNQMQSVMVAGYPLGRRLTFTGGVVSGYEAPEGEATEASQSYIQIDAPMNPGNSGGPLITMEGRVVGVNSAGIPSAMAQNTNFAIPARVVMSILRELFARDLDTTLKKVVIPPTLGITTQRVTPAHYKYLGIETESDHVGVMVKDVLRGSSFSLLRSGDILRAIKMSNPYASDADFEVESYRVPGCTRCVGETNSEIVISNTGLVKFYVEGVESQYTLGRRVSLQELLDTIPIGTMLVLEIWRKDEGVLDSDPRPFVCQIVLAIATLYPPFDNLDFVIFAGAVWVPLSANIITALGDTKYICDYVPFENRYEPVLIVANIFPTAEMRTIEAINATETLTFLNGIQIKTPSDLRKAIVSHLKSKSSEPWQFRFKSGKLIVLDKLETFRKDKEILDTFKVPLPAFNTKLYSMFA